MDAAEIARQAAHRLHLAAVAAGSDPWQPLPFAWAEASRRGIDVFPVAASNPGLKGGRAVYDYQAGHILIDDGGSDFDRAFLIAHEIAHVELEGTSTDSVASDIDPARSSESSSVATERVVDYSRRERREVRMDLFAREFLMPRAVLHDLYVNQGMERQAIAHRLGAPIDAVTQQLLDALLLPVVSLEPRAAQPPREPDDSQKVAAQHRGPAYQLQAGPGTGKTQTLINHIDGLLSEGVEPEAILCLTFSNKAAGELIERLTEKHPVAAAGIWVGTFHSFGLDVVRRFHDRLGLPASPRLIDRTEAIELLEDELARLPLHHFRNLWDPTLVLADILAGISRAKDEVTDAATYRKLADAMLAKAGNDEEARVGAEKCVEVALVYQVYETLLKERGIVDFGDLVSLPVRLVEQDADARQALAARHRHIIVDEYQDVNRASVRLLKGLLQPGNRIWVVGDARQSIYRFRGASAINMARFADDFQGSEAGALSVNYRSFSQIVDCYSTFAASMLASAGSLPLSLQANRGSGASPPQLRIAGTPDDEIGAVAATIEEAKSNGLTYRDQAVLCAGNARLAAFASGLEGRGIPVLFLGNLFERSEVKALLATLSLLPDRYAAALVSVATLPSCTMSLDDVQRITAYLRDQQAQPLAWWSCGQSVPDLTAEGRNALEHIADALAGFDQGSNPWSVLTTLVLDKFGIARSIAGASTIAARMQGIAIWQLLNFCRAQPSAQGPPITRFLDRVRRLLLISDDRELRQLPAAALSMDGVRLMTIHGSKGLEFPIVHLPGLITTALPRSNTPPRCPPPDGMIEGAEGISGIEAVKRGHDQEQECIFFVALSRARDRLLVYASSRMENGNKRNPSPFLKVIAGHLNSITDPSSIPGQVSASPAVKIRWTEPLKISDHQIGQFDTCPRRFFYSHVLKLGGRRTETAFMQLHDALQTVLDWLAAEHPTSNPDTLAVEAAIESAWQKNGPTEHPYVSDYRKIAGELVDYLIAARASHKLLPPKPLTLAFGDSKITAMPNHVVTNPGGQIAVRRVKTGKLGSDEFKDMEYTVLLLAARDAYGPTTTVEAVHLTGGTTEVADISDRSLAGRKAKALEAMKAIQTGDFPRKPVDRRCPRCPHLFHCDALPAGAISAKI